MKLYILVKEDIPLGFAFVAVSHAPLIAHLKFKDDADYQEWMNSSFRKVVCKVNEDEFENAKKFEDYCVVTESTLNNKELALVFKPRKEYPKEFKYYRLYK